MEVSQCTANSVLAAIIPGQVWRHDQSGRDYRVTRVYAQALQQYAMLRPVAGDAPGADPLRITVAVSPEGCTLVGFTLAG